MRSFNEELNLFTDKKNLLPHINSTYHYCEIFKYYPRKSNSKNVILIIFLAEIQKH